MTDRPATSEDLRSQALAVAGVENAAPLSKCCSRHPDHPTALLCADCGEAICLECLAEIAEPLAISCAKCRELEKKKKSLRSFLAVLRLPAIWVLLCIFASALAYAAGLGNPRLEDLIRNDKGKEWNIRKAPQLLVRQAARERRHVMDLHKRNQKEAAARWAAWAAEAFQKTANLWSDAPVKADLEIAKAEMQEIAGDSKAALETLLSVTLPDKDIAYPVQQYRIGLLHEKQGQNKEASAYFEKALAGTGVSHEKSFEQMIDLLSLERRKADLQAKVRAVCGTAGQMDELASLCRKKLGRPEPKDALSDYRDDKAERPAEKPSFEVEFLSQENK